VRNKVSAKKNIWLWATIFAAMLCLSFMAWQFFVPSFFEKNWGSFMDFLSPHRYEYLYHKLKHASDEDLLRLLHSKDINKAEAAKVTLAHRADPELFERLLKKMKDPSEDVRIRVRGLLAAIDEKKAMGYYMDELKVLNKSSVEYFQILGALVRMKYQPVFPYLIAFAQSDTGNQHASADLLEEFGDPRTLPVLEEKLETDTSLNQFEKKRIRAAIKTIRGNQHNFGGTPLNSN
jgi:hypothetical protein